MSTAPFEPRYEKKPPYDNALIPNLASFKLVMMKADGSEVDGVVMKDSRGLHYVGDILGEKLDLGEFTGWRHSA